MRRRIGIVFLLSLAVAAIVSAGNEVVDPGGGGGGTNDGAEAWYRVDPDGRLYGPVESLQVRNGMGAIFLRRPAPGRPGAPIVTGEIYPQGW